MKNIMSGFRVTGVYPFDRNAISLPGEQKPAFDSDEVVRNSGLSYIPMYSPVRPVRVPRQGIDQQDCETPEPAMKQSSRDTVSAQNALAAHSLSQISDLLNTPALPNKLGKKTKPRSNERVLTSAANLKKIKDKEDEKKKKEQEKANRAQLRKIKAHSRGKKNKGI